MYMTLILEDIVIFAVYFTDTDKDGRPITKEKPWQVRVMDTFKNRTWDTHWSSTQIAAISALAHGIGEERGISPNAIMELYLIANEALIGCPTGMSPIP